MQSEDLGSEDRPPKLVAQMFDSFAICSGSEPFGEGEEVLLLGLLCFKSASTNSVRSRLAVSPRFLAIVRTLTARFAGRLKLRRTMVLDGMAPLYDPICRLAFPGATVVGHWAARFARCPNAS